MRIRAITLDVGGTLIEAHPSVGHVYAKAAAEHGAGSFDPAVVTQSFIKAWGMRKSFDYSKPAWFELVRGSFAGLLEVSEPLFDAIYDAFGGAQSWRVHEDVLPFLERARTLELPVLALSNWDERLKPLLKDLGLAHAFADIIVSLEAGAHKPDRRIFEIAAVRAGIPPNEILHIGDSRIEDLEGARRAGFQSLLLKRNEPAGESQIQNLLQAFGAIV